MRQILSYELLSFMLPAVCRMPVSMARNVTQSGTWIPFQLLGNRFSLRPHLVKRRTEKPVP